MYLGCSTSTCQLRRVQYPEVELTHCTLVALIFTTQESYNKYKGYDYDFLKSGVNHIVH